MSASWTLGAPKSAGKLSGPTIMEGTRVVAVCATEADATTVTTMRAALERCRAVFESLRGSAMIPIDEYRQLNDADVAARGALGIPAEPEVGS